MRANLVDASNGHDGLQSLEHLLEGLLHVLAEESGQDGLDLLALELVHPRVHERLPADILFVDVQNTRAGHRGWGGVGERIDLEDHTHSVVQWHTLVTHQRQHLEKKGETETASVPRWI